MKEARPELPFTIKEADGATIFTIRHKTVKGSVLGWAIALPALFCGPIAGLVGLFGLMSLGWRSPMETPFLIGALASVPVAYLIVWLGNRVINSKSGTSVVKIEEQGIVAKSTLYRWKDISVLSYRDGGLYIIHGAKQVRLVGGLSNHEPEVVRSAMAEACARKGYNIRAF